MIVKSQDFLPDSAILSLKNWMLIWQKLSCRLVPLKEWRLVTDLVQPSPMAQKIMIPFLWITAISANAPIMPAEPWAV